MSMTTTNSLYITYVEKHGAFLRIWGQIDKNLSMAIENSLLELTSQIDHGHYVPAINNIPIGLFCCAKYKDGKYYRARVSNVVMLSQNLVEVHFIDYGNKEILPVTNIRTINHLTPALPSLPPQAHDFILANVTHIGLAWDNNTIALISNEIRYMELQFIVMQQVNSYTLIKLFKNGEDFALTLFNRGLVLSMASVSQTMILQSSGVRSTNIPTPITPAPQPVVAPVTPTPALLSYKAVTIEPGTENNVYVSYVCDGPCQFSVQLQKLEDSLARLMRELNRMPLHPLEEDPLPGTVCVAKCIEDDHICRAVVTSMVDGQYKVFYVDFGNTEIVPITNLYQIPFKYVILKVMAMRYALAGLERSSVTLEMKCAFKEFVSDKLLRMRSLPPPSRSALPLCNLWDSNNINVLDVLKKAAMLAYPEAVQLTRGFSQEVLVSYVYSCSHFYVQLKAKEEDLRKVMAELQAHCPDGELVQASQIKPGLPCCALFDADAQWYRAQILAHEKNIARVRYVDYGNEELVDVNNLRMPVGNLLTALRPQALECCLNGYQNMGDDVERDNILEELILEKEFTMRVIEMQSSRALVDLIDNARYNVGSLLLERLASARSQVSPLLIQESHHIEQRKRQSPKVSHDGHNKFDRTNSRDSDKGWGRQDSYDKGFSPKESSEKTFTPRENRGFPKRDTNERFNQGSRDKNFSRDSNQSTNDDEWTNSNFKEKSWNQNKREMNSDNERNNNRRQESWRQEKPPRDDFKKDSWDDGGEKPTFRGKRDDFKKGGDSDQGFEKSWGKGKADGFKKDNWRNESSNWKQRSPNPKEASEKSWSDGSEKNCRGKSRDEKPFRKNDFKDRGNREPFTKPRSNAMETSFKKVEDPAEYTDVFTYLDLHGKTEEVLISWFHNPSNFFCQLKQHQEEFRNLMEDIQNTYCKIKPENVPVNAPVVALFPEDKVLYRGYVHELKGNQYHVQYVDFGNFATTSKVWPIEKKFLKLPAQAICCALNAVTPVNETDGWVNIDAFAPFFEKEDFTGTFTLVQDNGYLVDLFSGNQSLSESLITAGLAKPLVEEYFDSSILCGQQLRVTLGDIQSLQEFYIVLQNDVQLLSTLHNLETATETFEDTLKEYCGQVVIMYVDNVLEHALQITLYDTTGVKLKLVEPDEGAFETVDPFCPLPVLSSTISGWVSYLTPSDDKFKMFIQPTEYASYVVDLLDQLYNQYDTTTLETPVEVVIGSYYAIRSTDTNWYRGLVSSVEEENVTVTYVDYGNSETVAITEVRELTQEFKELHALALEVLVADIDDSYNEQEVTATVWYGEECWEATVAKTSDVQEVVEVPPAQIPIEPTTEEQPPQLPEPENVVQSTEEPDAVAIGFAVFLSHVDSPSQFYLQLQEALGEIEALQSSLQEQIDSYPDLENPAAGVLCAAPYSLDQQWYRAQVLDADNDITTVRFVDYGNTDVITNATTPVKTLSADMLALEQHARRCSLLVKPKEGEEWSSAAYERFEVLTSCDNLSIEIIHQDEKTTYVDLYANGVNVADALLQEDLAAKLELETESSCSGYVSNLNSPSEFWIQLENSVADLEWIADQLLSAANFPELEDLTPGSLCAALYPEDEMWYRARILSNTIAGLEVLFIDYGNSCTCTGLRQLPEDLIMLPALAQKCSLQKPIGLLQWPVLATDKFKEISADGATIFNIEKLSTGETLIVNLLLESEDISWKLMPETVKGYISHIDSVSSFWIQKDDDSLKLEEMSEEFLAASEWSICEEMAVGDIVAALQVEDELWYRAKVLSINDSEYEVLFIDYGNVGVTKDIRCYDKSDVPPLANKYKLEPLPGFRWMDNEATEKLKELSMEGATVFDVEFTSEDAVRLYLDGIDIRTNMDGVAISSVQSTPKKAIIPMSTTKDPEEELHSNEFLELIDDSKNVEISAITDDANHLEISDSVETNENISKLENVEELNHGDENLEMNEGATTLKNCDNEDEGFEAEEDTHNVENLETNELENESSEDVQSRSPKIDKDANTMKSEETVKDREPEEENEINVESETTEIDQAANNLKNNDVTNVKVPESQENEIKLEDEVESSKIDKDVNTLKNDDVTNIRGSENEIKPEDDHEVESPKIDKDVNTLKNDDVTNIRGSENEIKPEDDHEVESPKIDKDVNTLKNDDVTNIRSSENEIKPEDDHEVESPKIDTDVKDKVEDEGNKPENEVNIEPETTEIDQDSNTMQNDDVATVRDLKTEENQFKPETDLNVQSPKLEGANTLKNDDVTNVKGPESEENDLNAPKIEEKVNSPESVNYVAKLNNVESSETEKETITLEKERKGAGTPTLTDNCKNESVNNSVECSEVKDNKPE
ncbi:hypothetical protein RN001_008432 [Aquatica leii]|uniref:Tudor domain-containing protein n=1 Tax=Aquatica leii TaxID=1421715 RepID=A0AAN7PDA3_9COLE|nr:hypothetical protein RN001_008432 [Aquatica leii]